MVIRFNDLRLARFQNSEGMVPFFNADEGKRRMSAVRDWIVGVRHPADSWGERYSDLSTRVHDLYNSRRGNILAEFKEKIAKNNDIGEVEKKQEIEKVEESAERCDSLVKTLVEVPRFWLDAYSPGYYSPTNYIALTLYTSLFGYETLFSEVKRCFRSPVIPSLEEQQFAAFLIELVNIDLYNFWKQNNETAEGEIYRWINLPQEDISKFKNLLNQPPNKRDPNIPLALDSSTRECKEPIDTPHGVGAEVRVRSLYRINVFSLPNNWIEYYQSNYPKLYPDGWMDGKQVSVVSPICAMPIESVSEYKHEREVLLRGPFFHLLNVSEGPVEAFIPDFQGSESCSPSDEVHVVDLAMLDSNRDHPSTPQTQMYGGEDPARTLFNKLVVKRRLECCRDYYAERHIEKQREAFAQEAKFAAQRLEEFATENGLEQPPS